MNTVLVGEPLSLTHGYQAKIDGLLQRPGNAVAWVEIPAGLSTLSVHVRRDDGGDFHLMAQDPTDACSRMICMAAAHTRRGPPWSMGRPM